MSLVIIYIFMILAILAAIFALEFRRLMFSIIGLIAMNLFLWVLLLTLNAIFLAWIQLIVYGGGFTALFVVVVALTEKQRDESFDWKRSVIALAIVAILMGIAIWGVIASDLSITFGTSTIGESLRALWTERLTDLILQAVVFFATSIGIGSLFIHQKKKHKEETKA